MHSSFSQDSARPRGREDPGPVGRIFNIMRFSLNDGPGIRTTVFLKGCPLDCWWCHNPEGMGTEPQVILRADRCINCGNCVGACPSGAITQIPEGVVTSRDKCAVCGTCVTECYAGAREIVGREITVPELMKDIVRDRPFFEESGGGVTFSGGEPLLQIDFLSAALVACKATHLHTVVETSGYAPARVLERIIGSTDLFLYDLKLLDEDRHRRFTGVSNGVILENLSALLKAGRSVIVRVPLVAGINDDDMNVLALGEYLVAQNKVREVHLLPFHEAGEGKYDSLGMPYRGEELTTPTPARLMEAAEKLTGMGFKVTIGG